MSCVSRQLSVGNFYISVEQVVCSLKLQRLKLFDSLKAKKPAHEFSGCCTEDFADEELEVLDNTGSNMDNITEEENATLYFIAGYIAKKTGDSGERPLVQSVPESEFVELVSRGRLTFPSSDLFLFSRLSYIAFSRLSALPKFPSCASRVRRLFLLLLESADYNLADGPTVCRKLTNTFFKGICQLRNTQLIPIAPNAASTERRKRKLTAAS